MLKRFIVRVNGAIHSFREEDHRAAQFALLHLANRHQPAVATLLVQDGPDEFVLQRASADHKGVSLTEPSIRVLPR